MAYLANKSLFFTTSPRTPAKMIPEIRLLSERFAGREWTKQTQIEFMDSLAESDFFEGAGSKANKDFSARDRINRAPKALGFVDLKPRIKLTAAGKDLVYGNRPQEIFLRQLLKFQFPSPYHVEKENIKGNFFIRPYLEIMRLVRDLGYLSFDELKMFALMLTDYRAYDVAKKDILEFRKMKNHYLGQYKKFSDEIWTELLLRTYSAVIKAGKTKTRETRDKSLKKFLTTKKSNARDYADACFRYLRYTGLVSISYKNRSISFYPEKLDEVDFILETVDRNPVFIDDPSRYKAYLFDATAPVLYTDNVENVINCLVDTGKYTHQQICNLDINHLKDLRDGIIEGQRKAVMARQIAKIKSHALYPDIVRTFTEIVSKECYDAPLMLEYNTWRAMTMLNGGNIKGNFKFDDEGQPLSTAAGNMPDIECDYGDFALSVEVTMQRGQRQYESEGEPVTRHFGQMRKKTGKETYCLFIAPTINQSCLAYFFLSNKTNTYCYNGKTKIIPLKLDQFVALVKKSHHHNSRPTPKDIRRFLDEVMLQGELSDNENDWNNKIQDCIERWLVA